MASFPDIPEALTGADTREETLDLARDALITALDFYFEDRRAIPLPGKIGKGKDFVELPASVAAKVLLLNEMVSQHIRPADLARRMKTSPQEISRITDLKHTTKVDNVQAALQSLGKSLELSLA